jgi:hypothetical protein
MPNWCANTIEISSSKENIDEFERYLNENNGKNWFDYFVDPVAEDDENWYQHNLDKYGCKWNCDAQDWTREGDKISFWFDSPWAPPTNLYETIAADGEFDVTAHYLEEGMAYVGRFADGEDEYYDYEDLNSLEAIPDEIVEQWDLRQRVLDNEDMWEDEEENDEK